MRYDMRKFQRFLLTVAVFFTSSVVCFASDMMDALGELSSTGVGVELFEEEIDDVILSGCLVCPDYGCRYGL